MPLRLLYLLVLVFAVGAQASERTIRICDDSGCSDRPRSSATFDPTADPDPQVTRRLEALTALAEKDPRAAYDLGLRYFRGDGVEQNSFRALEWMRSAGERGDLAAQSALGRFYLAGLEEMGPDPIEAERWLTAAASRGDKEAGRLLAQARRAKANEAEYYRWRREHRNHWIGFWYTGYPYRWYWRAGGWHYRH